MGTALLPSSNSLPTMSYSTGNDEFGLQQIKTQGLEMKSWLELELETRWSPKQMQRVLGTLGPLLLVITFIEDGLRVLFRWSEQMAYLTGTRHGMGMSSWLAIAALLTSLALQLGGSMLVLQGKHIPQVRGQHVKIGGGASSPFSCCSRSCMASTLIWTSCAVLLPWSVAWLCYGSMICNSRGTKVIFSLVCLMPAQQVSNLRNLCSLLVVL